MEVCITLTRYCVLFQALFQARGPTNPFVATHWQVVASHQNAARFITEQYMRVARVPVVSTIYFAGIVRAIQVGVHEYLHLVATYMAEGHDGIELPDFRTLTVDLKRGTFVQSSH
jgi:hypothetical protein